MSEFCRVDGVGSTWKKLRSSRSPDRSADPEDGVAVCVEYPRVLRCGSAFGTERCGKRQLRRLPVAVW